jgi:chromate reductase, NAD(P)H dehydrogenase (quinone)
MCATNSCVSSSPLSLLLSLFLLSFSHSLNSINRREVTHKEAMASGAVTLKTVVFVGSSRTGGSPWDKCERYGTRVLKYVLSMLSQRDTAVQHDVTVLDPLEIELPLLHKPHFYYKAGEAPVELESVSKVIESADCFVIISPEYNHTIPPALTNFMDHFGCSKYAFKPSGIVTYSVGQWGGRSAAMALRPFTSELGCLSVSRICSFAFVSKAFDENGVPSDPDSSSKFLCGMLNQLEWWAQAAKTQRETHGLPK